MESWPVAMLAPTGSGAGAALRLHEVRRRRFARLAEPAMMVAVNDRRSRPIARRGGSLLAAMLLFAGATVPIAQTAAAIAGRVVDRNGQGLSGATVSARPIGTGPLVRAVSGEDGSYRLERLAAGAYRVTVSLEGWDAARYNHVLVGAGATATLNATLDISVVCECIEPPAKPPRRGLYIGIVA